MNRRKWFRSASAGALAAVCAGLGGCTRQYFFENMTARYQAPQLPTEFATTNENGFRISGAFAFSDQGRYMDIARQDTLWPLYGEAPSQGAYFSRPYNDTAALARATLLQERYRFDRQPLLAEGDFAYIGTHWFGGFAAGIGAPDMRCGYIGYYLGYSQLLFGDRVAPTIGLGAYLERFPVTGKYWSHSSDPVSPGGDALGTTADPPTFYRNSTRAWKGSFSFPFKMGFLYRLRKGFQPYILMEFNTVSLWPDETEDPGRYEVDDGGFALGFRNESMPGLELSLELQYQETDGPMGNINFGPGLAFRLQHRI